jgi:transcriptional regulator with XRE-family HTH domain
MSRSRPRATRPPHARLGMELKIARQLARVTQLQLAELAGVDDSTISLIENGQRDIYAMSYASVVRLARALGVEPGDLWPVPPLPKPDPSEVRE